MSTVQGLALFLLLSFRTNSSYERWWEGRKVWEGMACKIQDTARIAMGKILASLGKIGKFQILATLS